MPAIVNYAAEPHSVELREVPLPDIGEDDVLMKVAAVGVCGSDLHQWTGQISWTVNYPCILGHEFAGTIVRSGKRVKSFSEGDRVVSETAAVIDENSPFSKRGLYNLDSSRLGFGYGVNGAMTQYVRVPERCLHPIPNNLTFVKASLTEPCCVAYNAVCCMGRIQPGDAVLVLGPGPIGLLCVLMAKLAGAGHLVVCGLPADHLRLNKAVEIGAHHTLYPEEVSEYFKNIADGEGADVVIDATGYSPSFETAMDVVRPAGQIIKVGWGPQPMNFSLDRIIQKAVTVKGSFSHHWMIWERVISMLQSGQINLDPVLSRISPLEEWHECFEKMHHGEYVKTVLEPFSSETIQ